ncbi:MAG: NAD-binding protein [Arhodomonas sp.]|nr:NAD-binding protein [Arhodomonas sp.]
MLICGYGDTGTQLAWEVTEGLQRAVVIDWDERKLDGLSTEGHRSYIPSLCGDANLTDNLLAAGLTHPGAAPCSPSPTPITPICTSP